MITIYSEKKETRNNAMPSHSNNSVATESVISGSLMSMRELVKKNLASVKKHKLAKRKIEVNVIKIPANDTRRKSKSQDRPDV